MKTTIAFLGMILTSTVLFAQSTQTLTAQFQGYDGEVYMFADGEDFYDFHSCAKTVLTTYDLTSEEFVDEVFKISYTIKTDEDGDETWNIQKLEVIEIMDEDEE